GRDGEAQAGEERGGEGVVAVGAELDDRLVGVRSAAAVDSDGLGVGIRDPILDDTETLVNRTLLNLIASSVIWGNDLDRQVRRTLDVLLGHDRPARIADVKHVGLGDVVGREDYVEGS